MGNHTLWTIGYGGLATKAQFEFFQAVLATLKINWLIDVRRDPTRAFRHWWTQQYLNPTIWEYASLPELGNQHNALPWKRGAHADSTLQIITKVLRDPSTRLALLCAERPGITYEGTVRCHRIEIAQELLARLGSNWAAYDLWLQPPGSQSPLSYKTVPIPRTIIKG